MKTAMVRKLMELISNQHIHSLAKYPKREATKPTVPVHLCLIIMNVMTTVMKYICG